MENKIVKTQEKLYKLRRNEHLMTDLQKKQYAKSLQAFRSEICVEVFALVQEFVFLDCCFLRADEECVKKFCSEARDVLAKAIRENLWEGLKSCLFKTYSLKSVLDMTVPLKLKITFEVYAPYFVSKCFERDGQIISEILDALLEEHFIWSPEQNLWVRDSDGAFGIFLPPTDEECKKRYCEELKRYETRKKL